MLLDDLADFLLHRAAVAPGEGFERLHNPWGNVSNRQCWQELGRGEALLTSRQSMPCVFMRKILTKP